MPSCQNRSERGLSLLWIGGVEDLEIAGNNCLHYFRKLMFVKHNKKRNSIVFVFNSLLQSKLTFIGRRVKKKNFFATQLSHNICNISVERDLYLYQISNEIFFFSVFLFDSLQSERNLIILTSNIVSIGQIKSNNETC